MAVIWVALVRRCSTSGLLLDIIRNKLYHIMKKCGCSLKLLSSIRDSAYLHKMFLNFIKG